jgi:hypothetical protein
VALQGTLDTFSLPDVLRLLATTGKSGCLHVDGDRGRGNVWLDDGAVVAATAERVLGVASIDEVIFEIMRFGRGSFDFAADEQAPHEDQQPKEVESTLRRATQLLDEWRELESVVPSLGHRVALAPELTVEQVTIDAPRWEALVAIASGRSVGELAESLDLGELAVSRTVSDLVELGVAVVEPPGAARAPSTNSRRSSSDSLTRSSGDTPRRSAAAAPSNGKLEVRERDVAAATPSGDNGRTSWLDEPPPAPVETAPPKPRSAKSTNSRQPRPRRTGPTPTTVTPSGPSPTAPARNGQSLTGTVMPPMAPSPMSPSPLTPSPLSPSPMAPYPAMPPMPGPSSSPGDRGRPPMMPPGAPTAPVPAISDSYRGPLLPPTLDTGRLGPSPLTHDTGQIPTLGESALPPDLSWAAEDHEPPAPSPTPPPGSLRGSSGRLMAAPPGRPVSNGRNDTEVAEHVSAMSPEARAAVEATVGRSGGGPGGMPMAGASQDQILSRSQLLNFLSSVRR